MKAIIDYLGRLESNNSREWFNRHKSEYLDSKKQFDELVESIIHEIRKFDDSIGLLTAADCTYRIYRDTRFSQDKSPYKTHLGAYIAPGGKKSGYSGYYFQVGCQEDGFTSGCMIAVGNYYCEPNVLRTLREDIEVDNQFIDIINNASGFTLDREQSLKRVPKGWPIDHPMAEYLKLKNFCLVKDCGLDYFLQPNLVERLSEDFMKTKPFLEFLNRAIRYTKEEY